MILHFDRISGTGRNNKFLKSIDWKEVGHLTMFSYYNTEQYVPVKLKNIINLRLHKS